MPSIELGHGNEAGSDHVFLKEVPMSRYLVVLPDDSAQPILDAINHAKKSLRIKMFLFSDPAAAARGDRGAPARRESADHAESGAPQRRERER